MKNIKGIATAASLPLVNDMFLNWHLRDTKQQTVIF